MMLRPKKFIDPKITKTCQYPSVFMSLSEQNKGPSSLYQKSAYSQINKRPGLIKPARDSVASTPEMSKHSSPSRGVRFSDFKSQHNTLVEGKRVTDGWVAKGRKNASSVQVPKNGLVNPKTYTSEYMLQASKSSWTAKTKANSTLPKFNTKNSQKMTIKQTLGKSGWKSGSGVYCDDGNAYLTG